MTGEDLHNRGFGSAGDSVPRPSDVRKASQCYEHNTEQNAVVKKRILNCISVDHMMSEHPTRWIRVSIAVYIFWFQIHQGIG